MCCHQVGFVTPQSSIKSKICEWKKFVSDQTYSRSWRSLVQPLRPNPPSPHSSSWKRWICGVPSAGGQSTHIRKWADGGGCHSHSTRGQHKQTRQQRLDGASFGIQEQTEQPGGTFDLQRSRYQFERQSWEDSSWSDSIQRYEGDSSETRQCQSSFEQNLINSRTFMFKSSFYSWNFEIMRSTLVFTTDI